MSRHAVAARCAVIAPFGALHLPIQANRRREALRREQAAGKDEGTAPEGDKK